MRPSPALLQRLDRSKLLPRWAAATVGIGERRSRAKGAGMEFADHRSYQVGDDLRHLDPHLHARTGENFIRQYEVHRQLPITIIVDASRSMRSGTPDRYGFALELAGAIGFVGLAGGDQVRFAIGRGGDVEWSSRFQGASRASAVFDWLMRDQGDGGSFEGCLKVAARQIGERGLTIVLSDWWDEPARDIDMLAATGQEIWGIHILAREELDPALLGEGDVRMIDAESGAEVDLSLDRGVLDQYKRVVDAWKEDLRVRFAKVQGRYLPLSVDTKLDKLLLQGWRREGLLG
jgi:uncharacterized protein (DUF58 family)